MLERFSVGGMTRTLRYLRIAFTVFCGIVALLLIVFWVRSYWWLDGAMGSISPTKTLVVGSNSGSFSVRLDDSIQPHRYSGPWRFDHTSLVQIETGMKELGRTTSFRFPMFGFSGDDFFFSHWFVIIPFTVLSVALSRPWLPYRFSLRTLLIAATLGCIALWLAVWLIG